MCFDADARPPIEPMAGAAVAHHDLVLEAADGNHLAAFAADAEAPSGAGILVLPDVRGLYPYYEELALRFAEAGIDAIAIDYYGRTAGASKRDASFEFASHTARTTWDGLQADVRVAAAELRGRRDVRRLYAIGFCFGGRLAFLTATLDDVAMDGVIGFYGWPVGPARNDTPAPADVAARMRASVLGIFGGADHGIGADDVAAFGGALEGAGVEHRIVTYPGAPHSFFDRTQEDHADTSAAAWDEVLAFIG